MQIPHRQGHLVEVLPSLCQLVNNVFLEQLAQLRIATPMIVQKDREEIIDLPADKRTRLVPRIANHILRELRCLVRITGHQAQQREHRVWVMRKRKDLLALIIAGTEKTQQPTEAFLPPQQQLLHRRIQVPPIKTVELRHQLLLDRRFPRSGFQPGKEGLQFLLFFSQRIELAGLSL